MTNEDRAAAVDEAMKLIEAELFTPGTEDPGTIAGDAICDILHWIAEKSGLEGAAFAMRSGISNFCIEYNAGPGTDAEADSAVAEPADSSL